MNHYKASRQALDGRWRFICIKSNGLFQEVGYCVTDKGHETKEAAIECFRQWQIDNTLVLTPHDKEQANPLHRCELCREFTANVAYVGYGIQKPFHLCDTHLNKESVDLVFKAANEFWTSY